MAKRRGKSQLGQARTHRPIIPTVTEFEQVSAEYKTLARPVLALYSPARVGTAQQNSKIHP